MAIRNINKSLAGMEDLLIGVGKQAQTRNGSAYNIGRLDLPYAVANVTELKALDVDYFTRARVYSSTTEYSEYVYDSADVTGISPDVGIGSWLFTSICSDTSANLALLSASVNTVNKYAGKQEWDTTTNRPVWAVGPLAADVWVYSDGATAQTPV